MLDHDHVVQARIPFRLGRHLYPIHGKGTQEAAIGPWSATGRKYGLDAEAKFILTGRGYIKFH